MKPDFLDRFSKNTQISGFTKISSSGNRNFPDEQTGRYDETNSRLSQICENLILIEKYNYFESKI